MIIVSTLTLFLSIAFWIWFPDNPPSARFLTQDEKVKVVHRIRVNQNGIETKVWKRSQWAVSYIIDNESVNQPALDSLRLW
jgi:MFS transporter, ACS family, allantoate permease